MKKLFTLLFLALATATFAAEWAHPGWKCTDKAKLNEAMANATKQNDKILVSVLLKLADTPAKSFEELRAIINNVIDEVEVEVASRDAKKIGYAKVFACNRGEFVVEAWELCKKYPSYYDIHFVRRNFAELGFSDAERYVFARDFLLKGNYNVAMTGQTLDLLIDLAASVDGTDGINVKSDLQKLNRKFSRKLLDDKAAWEPVIAKIRTTLETY